MDLASLLKTLHELPPSTYAIIFALYILGQVLSALKWWVFVSEAGIKRPFSVPLKAYFFGMFVNSFGLGTLGGDLVRSVALLPAKGQRAAALATVVADRVHGLLVLITIGAIGVLFVRPEPLEPYGVPVSLMLVVLFFAAWWIGPNILLRMVPEEHRFRQTALMVSAAFPRASRPFLISTFYSTLSHLTQIWMHLIVAEALGLGLTAGYLFATVPIINTASSLPLSINGLGIREAAYLFLFGAAGVSQESIAALGLIWFGTVTIVSALGGLFVPLSLKATVAKELPGSSEALQKSDSRKVEGAGSKCL